MSVNAAGTSSPVLEGLFILAEDGQADPVALLGQTVLRREEEAGDDWDVVNGNTPHHKGRTPSPEVQLPSLSNRVENRSPKADLKRAEPQKEAPPILEKETSCLQRIWEIVSSLIEKVVSPIFHLLCGASGNRVPNSDREGMESLPSQPATALNLMKGAPHAAPPPLDLSSSTVLV